MRTNALTISLAALLLCLGPSRSGATAETGAGAATVAAADRDLTELSLTELLNIEVTSVSKKPEPLVRAAAAVYVITGDDIRRSGVTTIAEALRLAPGVQVSRINANQWAIGVRGFASRLSRAVLVLIDGRSVYTPLFRGTYWEAQETLLADIDRIEVIRGPGGTVWGANAFNGVINIITKNAALTEGTRVQVRAGTEEHVQASARYGAPFGTNGHFRAYTKYSERGQGFRPAGDEYDDWSLGQGGFRADWGGGAEERDTFGFQGDYYGASDGERTTIPLYDPPYLVTVDRAAKLSGGNLLGHWDRRFPGGASLRTQIYVDGTRREQVNFSETRTTFDVESREVVPLRAHELTVGGGIRTSANDTHTLDTLTLDPAGRNDVVLNVFAEDRLKMAADRVRVELGVKLEHNDFTGVEVQPRAAVTWSPDARQALWGSLSRAVRTPSTVDEDIAITTILDPTVPSFSRFLGSKDFKSETIVALQAGYRIQPRPRVSFDLATFYNRYGNLLSLDPRPPFEEPADDPVRTIVPIQFGNGLEGDGYGAEAAVVAQIHPRVRLYGNYSYLVLDLRRRAGSTDPTVESQEGSAPRHQLFVRGAFNPTEALALDLLFRHVGELPAQLTSGYESVDARVAYDLNRRVQLSLVGQNLLDAHHAEFTSSPATRTELERGVFGEVTLRW